MADTKITDLASLTGASVATTDVFVVVDVSDTTMAASGTDKKITQAELVTGLGIDAKAAASDLTNHLNDTVDAHDASAISFTPAGAVAATDVQAAIAELDTEKSATGHTHAYVAESVLDANTVLYATTDNTPAALAVAASRIVGRKATGDIVALTGAEAGAIIGAGSVATDAIFDAKGDLPVGTGADTAAKLTVGTNGYALVPDSSQSTGLAWRHALLTPGHPVQSGGINSDDWFFPPGVRAGGALSIVTLSAGTAYYIWFEVHEPITITGAAVRCTTLAASSLVRAGIVTLDQTYQPASLVTEFATFDTSGTGVKSVTGLSVALTPGLYATVVKAEVGNPAMVFATTIPVLVEHFRLAAGGVGFRDHYKAISAGAYANPPAAWDTTINTGGGYSFLFLRWTQP